jgi:RNA polymerase sigma-70 factor (ECF subfamily)
MHRRPILVEKRDIPWNAPVGPEGFQSVGEAVTQQPQVRDEAFAEFVLPEVEVLLRVARTLTAQPADAEDLVQDTLLRAYRAIDRFDGEHPRAWLLTIMRRAEINRHRRRRPHLLDDPDTDLDRLTAADTVASPEEAIVGEDFDEAVGAALADLSDKHQQVVRLVDIGGLTYAEAAEVLGVPEGTVMSRLHRARKRIRAQLAAAGLAPKRRWM